MIRMIASSDELDYAAQCPSCLDVFQFEPEDSSMGLMPGNMVALTFKCPECGHGVMKYLTDAELERMHEHRDESWPMGTSKSKKPRAFKK